MPTAYCYRGDIIRRSQCERMLQTQVDEKLSPSRFQNPDDKGGLIYKILHQNSLASTRDRKAQGYKQNKE